MRTLAHSARRARRTDSGAFLAPVSKVPPLHKMLPSPVDKPDRVAYFLARVQKAEGCWEWQGSRSSTGYGTMHLGKRNGEHIRGEYSPLAHRMAYWLWVGPIPDGLTIDHLCKNRACVNPAHLEAVTQSVNASRSDPPATHCPQGHEYTPENTYTHRKRCKTCVRARQREAYARRRQ